MKANTETRMIHEQGWAMAVFRPLPEPPYSQNGDRRQGMSGTGGARLPNKG